MNIVDIVCVMTQQRCWMILRRVTVCQWCSFSGWLDEDEMGEVGTDDWMKWIRRSDGSFSHVQGKTQHTWNHSQSLVLQLLKSNLISYQIIFFLSRTLSVLFRVLKSWSIQIKRRQKQIFIALLPVRMKGKAENVIQHWKQSRLCSQKSVNFSRWFATPTFPCNLETLTSWVVARHLPWKTPQWDI